MNKRQELKRRIYLHEQAVEILQEKAVAIEDEIHNHKVTIAECTQALQDLDKTIDSLAEKMEKWAA